MSPKARTAQYEPARFINVDLEIGARGKLDALVCELTPRLFELFRGKLGALNRVHYEVGVCVSDADSTMLALVEAVQGLTPAARRSWDRAAMRDFNIGIQAGMAGVTRPGHFELAIASTTLAQVAALGGRVVVTVYPPCPARPRRRVARSAPARPVAARSARVRAR